MVLKNRWRGTSNDRHDAVHYQHFVLRPLAIVLACLGCLTITVAQQPNLIIQSGHAEQVRSVVFSPDGKLLASGSADYTVRLWDVATGQELRAFAGHKHQISSVVFSHDGSMIASGSADATAIIWDLKTGRALQVFAGHDSDVETVVFSPDDKLLITGAFDHTIRIWDVASGREVRTLTGHSGPVSAVVCTPDGKLLVSGSDDHTIRIWDMSDGRELSQLLGHTGKVESLSLNHDGKLLVSGGDFEDNTIRVWDIARATQVSVLFKGKEASTPAVAFSSNSNIVAAGINDNLLAPSSEPVTDLSKTLDAIEAADVSFAKIWDLSSGRLLATLKSTDTIRSLALSPDNRTLAIATDEPTIRLIKIGTGQDTQSLQGRSRSVVATTFNGVDNSLAESFREFSGNVRLWDTKIGAAYRTIGNTPHTMLYSLAFSPNGRLLVGGGGNNVTVWDAESGKQRLSLLHYSTLWAAWSPDSKIIATANGEHAEHNEAANTIKLWSAETGAEIATLAGHTGYVVAIAFSPDGKQLASTSLDGTIKIWNMSEFGEFFDLVEPNATHSKNDLLLEKAATVLVGAASNCLVFNPRNGTLATARRGETAVSIWDLSDRRLIKQYDNLTGVTTLAFSADGQLLAVGGANDVVRVWNIVSGDYFDLKGHSSRIESVAFTNDGKILASGSWDATIKLWDVNSARELATLVALDESDWLVVTPDGLFDGSAVAWKQILWRFNDNTFDHAPVEAFFNEYYYPGLLADIFAGKRPKAPSDISQKDRRQPQVKLALAENQFTSNTVTTARNVKVSMKVAEVPADKDHKIGSGVEDVRLFRNGSLVKVWRGDVLKGQSTATLEATIPIVAGENKFTAYAFNHDSIKSSDAEMIVTGPDRLKREGTAYIVSIGINTYSNEQYNLKFAVADAEDFATEVKRQQQSLKRFAKVEVISLSDAEAKKANITQKLGELAKQVQPEDAVLVFFAGHGTAQGNQFYLIPHDLGYDGPRENLSKAGLDAILAHSISDRELEKLFEGIDAGQLLLVIDACNSGQALEAEEKRRGPMNSKGLAQLAYEKGMYVLTAAQSYQAAQEAAKFGHGFLTYALVEEGLKQGAADREPKNGSIDIREWLDFATDEVPKMQEQNSLDALRGRGRYIVFLGDGREFGLPKTESESKDNVQRPRVFYRRELEANPLVVGVATGRP